MYSFNNGHFISSSKSRGLQFQVSLACDPYEHGRALFHDMTDCKFVFHSAESMRDHIRASGIHATIHGYMIHSHRFSERSHTRNFWSVQHSIITNLRVIRNLQIFVAHVHPDHDMIEPSDPFGQRALAMDGYCQQHLSHSQIMETQFKALVALSSVYIQVQLPRLSQLC